MGGAVNPGGLEQVAGEQGDVAVKQEDRQRQAEAGVRQPDAEEGAVQVQAGVQAQHGDERHL